jgi:predicted lipoprotein with Yx(FWY)xxD motif
VVTEADTDLGPTLVDADGMTLYGLTDDSGGVSTCEGSCAEAWPPLTVAGGELPTGLDADVFSVVERSDGSFQLKAGAFPLYRFAGDSAPGDVNGQGSGGVWFAAAPDGTLIETTASAPQAPTGGY